MHPFVAEFIGTFMLMLFGNGVNANVLLSRTKGHDTGWLVIAAGWGLAVFIGAFCCSGVTGAHINPAVTVARMFTDTYTGIDPGSVALFVAVQLVAGLAAAQVSVPLFPTTPRHRHEET